MYSLSLPSIQVLVNCLVSQPLLLKKLGMERVVQSGFSGINLFSPPTGGSLRRPHNQIALQVSNLYQDYSILRRNECAISQFCSMGKEPMLMPWHLKSTRALKQYYGSPLFQCGARNSAAFFVGSFDASQEVDCLSEHIACKDFIQGESSVYSSSLTIEDAQKHADYMKKLIASIGAVILLSALTVISIHPALAVTTMGGTNAAARAGGSVAAVARQATSSLLRTELLSSAWTGLVAGVLHTLTGPDHLAALAPLSIGRTKMESAAVGALWGCGHDAGQVIFGILFLLLKDRLHIELLRSWGARVVGMTLLVIGAMGIKEASEIPAPCVALEAVDHQAGVLDSSPPMKNAERKFGFATFATGIVHGLQPDALLMILPALALPSRVAGAAFLCMFLVGTIVAMGSYTAFIGSCSSALKKRVPRITEGLSWGSSLIAIALGVAVLLSEYFGSSLF